MASEYDPVFGHTDDEPGAQEPSDLEAVRRHFAAAGRPYLRSPLIWLAWALLLPTAALAHGTVLTRFGLRGVVLGWSLAILAGGLVEWSLLFRSRPSRQGRSRSIVTWVFRVQGNLSLLGVILSVLLLAEGSGWALPGLWLLLVGHSFYVIGGLAFTPFRIYGLAFQLGGVAALWPGSDPLAAFAGVTGAANLWMAWRVWRLAAT